MKGPWKVGLNHLPAGFALNRSGDRKAAIETLEQVLDEHGPSSETCGLLGRVYKDLWNDARSKGDDTLAAGYLERSIDTYERGFLADWRDAYPGINAVTLLEVQGNATRRDELLPIVRFAVQQRLGSKPDYWDQATMLELAVIGGDEAQARASLRDAVTEIREPWEAGTTANNLELIREARRERGVEEAWLDEIIADLEARAE